MKSIIYLLIVTLFIRSYTSACPIGCSDCDKSQKICLKCTTDELFFISNGECQRIQNPIQNCNIYNQNHDCISCQEEYTLVKNKCLIKTIQCKSQNQYGQCNQCPSPLLLFNKICFSWSNHQICQHKNQVGECIKKQEFNNKNQKLNIRILQSTGNSTSTNTTAIVIIDTSTNNSLTTNISTGNSNIQPSIIVSNITGNTTTIPPISTTEITNSPPITITNIDTNTSMTSNITNTLINPPIPLPIVDTNKLITTNANSTNPINQTSSKNTSLNSSINQTPNCKSYDSNNVCIQCNTNYNLQNFQCVSIIPDCLNFGPDGLCLQCKTGILSAQNFCQDKNCIISSYGACKQCNLQYYLINNSCISIPVKNCASYNGINCLSCNMGYTLSNLICVQVNNPCIGYDNTTKLCTLCSSNFKLNSNSICIDVNCNISSNATCTTCNYQYFLLNENCIKSPYANCDIYSNGSCFKCSNRYYTLDNVTCIAVDSDCNTYNFSDGSCLTCLNNKILLNGFCVDKNCQTAVEKVCTICIKKYYLDSNSACIAIPVANCVLYQNGVCYMCDSGYLLTLGKCESSNGKNTSQNQKPTPKFNLNSASTKSGWVLSLQVAILLLLLLLSQY